ncbi:MAG: hypothetical protein F9K23_02790 [Bacteroidetes bacterium]|nr:MAG: hypothetical protein F9K23_02790 [Bacteroidota bacterium]
MNTLLKATAATIKHFIWVVLIVVNVSTARAADVPFLEKSVTVNASNQTFAEIFRTISNQTGVVFSYNSKQFDDQRKTSVSFYNKPLRVVLNALLKPVSCSYKLKKKYIIIKYSEPVPPAKKSTFTISGYLVSAGDSAKVKDASIFIKSIKQSAITDSFGYFKMVVSAETGDLSLSIAKENYKDTAFTLSGATDKELWLTLTPIHIPKVETTLLPQEPATETPIDTPAPILVIDSAVKDTSAPISKFWQKQKELNANFRNIRDTLFTKISFSLVPPLSTNKLLSYNTINKLSFNVLIGNSKGVDGLEIAGLLNYDFGDVQYVQMAGLGNIVGGNVKHVQGGGIFNIVGGNTDGVQAGGIFNTVQGYYHGLQIGGIFNIVTKDVDGMQLGGIFNYAEIVDGLQVGGIYNITRTNITGLQLGGIFNYANNINGVQIGGIYNWAKDTMRDIQLGGILNTAKYARGTQIGGIMNTAKEIDGVQIGGVMNAAKQITGVQVSGVMNMAKEVDGAQVTGVINIARKINGVQVACFNFADSCNGIPVGIFSFVRNGYHKIELSFDELKITSLGFRSGVDKFHNLLFAGYSNFGPQPFWTFGYGLSTYKKLTPKKGLLFDITTQQLQNTSSGAIKTNLLSRVNVSYSYAIAKKISLAVGPTFNFLQQEKTDNSFINTFNAIAPPTFGNNTMGNTQSTMWLGAKASIKFL